mgnify:CR=1 FL=1
MSHINIVVKIFSLIGELVSEIAKKSPLALLLIPAFLMGDGTMSGILVAGIVGFILLGGDTKKLQDMFSKDKKKNKKKKKKTSVF